MGNALRQLVSNLGSFILALLLAFTVWIAATLQNDPFSVQAFPNVPITIVNQPDNTIFFNESDFSEITAVTVRAPESVLSELRTSDFVATMDLEGAQSGTPTSVPIEVACSNEAVRIQSWSPSRQDVQLETLGSTTLLITIAVEGQVATGYQSSDPTVTPGFAQVQGPEPLLTKVVSLGGIVDVDGARADVAEKVRVIPMDADGQLVSGLDWTPDQVEVQVDVRRKLGYKPDVEVVPDLRGAPAAGYRLGSVSVEPSTVTLAGVPAVLDELPGFVETLPISVTNATADLLEHSPLTVPNTVVVVGVDYVTVTVEVLAIQSSQAMTASVEIQGVRPGWIATPSPPVVDVILEGPDATLAAMEPNDLRVIVDLFDYSLGVHRVEPDVLVPEGVTVVSIIPETIEVAITTIPTPTPTATVTPTVTATLTATLTVTTEP
jgi:YbbR domain-containing protein